MSFSSVAKSAAAIMPRHDDEQRAMLYGLLLFSHTFGADRIAFRTETADVADIFCGLLLGELDIMTSPEMHAHGGGTVYSISISSPSDLEKIGERFAASGFSTMDTALIKSDRAKIAFLRGVFLSCGYLNSPEMSYRLDFTVPSGDLAVSLAVLLSQTLGKLPKLSVRKSNQIVYFRDVETITDFMNMIGLSTLAFDIMNSQIERDIRNNINRKTNFDVANIGKKTAASVLQTEAIESLISCGAFESLPLALRTTAKLRLEHPDASLEFIGELENPPISKSQVSKRFKQIVELSKTIQKG